MATESDGNSAYCRTRYAQVRSLSSRHGREVSLCCDRVTGQSVAVKSARFEQTGRELRALLDIPPEVGPEVLDVAWSGDGRLTVVMEYLRGETLDQVVSHTPAERVPLLVRQIVQALVSLHRGGWAHCDLKPQNILVLDDSSEFDFRSTTEDSGEPASQPAPSPNAEPRVRLLDFGFSLESAGGSDEPPRGGTPPYIAPEIPRGWIVDGRADLYSLGIILRNHSSTVAGDARWAPILEKLTDPMPARRYTHSQALREELERIFELPPSPARFPVFGGGILRGRSNELKKLVTAARTNPGDGFLIQARRGIGLSRLLFEAVLELAATGGPPACMIDLARVESETAAGGKGLSQAGTPGSPASPEEVDIESSAERERILEAATDGRQVVFCGVADPSPGFWWTAECWRGWLLRRAAEPRWQRFSLAPLDQESFDDLLSSILGSGDKTISAFARQLHGRIDGRLEVAADGFEFCVRRCGREDGPSWTLNPDDTLSTLAEWHPEPRAPKLADVPPDLIPALSVCARIGPSFARQTAAGVLDRFCGDSALTRLLDHGYLKPEDGDRLGFVTRAFSREAIDHAPPQVDEIDAWLLTHHEPDLGNVEEALIACRRARRQGDLEREGRYLSAAMVLAFDQWWLDVLVRLFSYPDAPPDAWSVELFRRQFAVIREIVGDHLEEQRLALMAALGIRQRGVASDRRTGTLLLEEVAAGPDPQTSAIALSRLAQPLVGRPSSTDLVRYLEVLRRLAGAHSALCSGLLENLLAQQAFRSEDSVQAESLARQAAEHLRGTGLSEEFDVLLVLAITQFERDEAIGIAAMRRALSVAPSRLMASVAWSNLSNMFYRSGDFEACAECAADGISTLQGRVPAERIVKLRTLRVDAWHRLDRVDRAAQEARVLLSLPRVQNSPMDHVALRTTLGSCYLARGSGELALHELWQACLIGVRSLNPAHWSETLQVLFDAVLDLQAWDFIRERDLGSWTAELPGGAMVRSAMVRRQALLLQLHDRLDEAARILEEGRSDARTVPEAQIRIRYLHHLGLVRLSQCTQTGDRAAAKEATDLFREELNALPPRGLGYIRSRALQVLSQALRAVGDEDKAQATLAEAITLSRRIQSLGVLTQCLETRARWAIEKGGTAKDQP